MTWNFGRNILGLLGAALLTAGLLGDTAQAAEPSYSTWFSPAEVSKRAWSFFEVEGDAYSMSIKPKRAGPKDSPRRIFVLFPRRSSAYDVAMAQILQVFEEKNINANFTLVNFDNNHARGKQAMKMADEGGFELVFSMGSQSTAWLWENYRGGALPGHFRLFQGSGRVGTGPRLRNRYRHQLRLHLAQHADRSANGLRAGTETQPQEPGDPGQQPEHQRRADPGQADRRLCAQRGIRVLDVEVEDPKHAGEELAYKVRDAVRTMRKNDPTLDSSVFWITGSTAVFREIRAINANSDRVPVLSVVPDVVKEGEDSAALSIGISFESNAHFAAIYGADVLEGRAKVGDLKVGIVSPPDIAINFLKAREIGLEIPFSFFESASFVYDYDGRIRRNNGKAVVPVN